MGTSIGFLPDLSSLTKPTPLTQPTAPQKGPSFASMLETETSERHANRRAASNRPTQSVAQSRSNSVTSRPPGNAASVRQPSVAATPTPVAANAAVLKSIPAGPIGPAKPIQAPPTIGAPPPGIKKAPIARAPLETAVTTVVPKPTGIAATASANPKAEPSAQSLADATLDKTASPVQVTGKIGQELDSTEAGISTISQDATAAAAIPIGDSAVKNASSASADLALKPTLTPKPEPEPQAVPAAQSNLAAKTTAPLSTEIAPKPLASTAGTSPKAAEASVKSTAPTRLAASERSDTTAEPVSPAANPDEESDQEIAAADNAADDAAKASAESDTAVAEEPSDVAGPSDLGPDLAALTQSPEPLSDEMTGIKTDLFARPVAEASVSQSGNSFASGPLQPGLATTAADGPSAAGQSPVEQTASSESSPSATPALQVAVQISRSFNGQGAQSFNIQLKPERLGTVDVKLDIDEKGKATATVTADRPETLQLLRQDAHHLIRSLNEAGISADSSTLSFSLKDTSGGSFSNDAHRSGQGQNGGTGTSADEVTAAETEPAWTDPNRILDFHA